MNAKIKNSKKPQAFITVQQTLNKKIVGQLRKTILTEKYKPFILFIIFGLLAYDIFSSAPNSDIKFFGITILYFIIALFYKLKSRMTFIICLILLLLMFINFLLSGTSNTTEKIAVWLFLFMVVGIIQQWRE